MLAHSVALASLALAPPTLAFERFGLALATLDVDGDGRPELVVSDGQESPERLLVLTLEGKVLFEIPAGEGESGFGSILAPAADLDGDGIADLLVGIMDADGVGCVRVISGGDARVIHEVRGPDGGAGFGVSLTPLSDLDDDGVPDWAAGTLSASSGLGAEEEMTGGSVLVHSGADGSLLLEIAPEAAGSGFGCGVTAYPDGDDDGLKDLLVTERPVRGAGGALWLVSSADGTVLRRWSGSGEKRTFGARTLLLPDVDAGGDPEILVTIPATFDPPSRILLMSGETAAPLWRHEASIMEDTYLGVSAVLVGDLDEDGVPDVALGGCAIRSGIPGRVRILSGADGEILRTFRREDYGEN